MRWKGRCEFCRRKAKHDLCLRCARKDHKRVQILIIKQMFDPSISLREVGRIDGKDIYPQ